MENKRCLVELTRILRRDIQEFQGISASFSNSGLKLLFDLKKGFESYEKVLADYLGRGIFKVKYSALAPIAFNTFLRERKYERYFNQSRVLRDMRHKVQEIKDKGRFETYEKEKGEFYTQFISLEEMTSQYSDIENAMYFFKETFKEKSIL